MGRDTQSLGSSCRPLHANGSIACSLNPRVRDRVDAILNGQQEVETSSAWFQQTNPGADLVAAYFSMEYMLSEALPIYAGGLGNVAGDHL